MSRESIAETNRYLKLRNSLRDRLSRFGSVKTDTILGGTTVTVVAGLFLWWFTWAFPNLQYSDGEVIKFAGTTDADSYGLFVITISNDGRRMAEDLKCQIELAESKIQEVKAGPLLFEPKERISDDGTTATITCPVLNAGESLDVAIKASNPKKLSQFRKITLRAKDVVGARKTKRDFRLNDVLVVVLTGVILLLIRSRIQLMRFMTQKIDVLEKNVGGFVEKTNHDLAKFHEQFKEARSTLDRHVKQREEFEQTVEKAQITLAQLRKMREEKVHEGGTDHHSSSASSSN